MPLSYVVCLTITAAAAGNPVYDPDADPDAPAVPDPVAAVPIVSPDCVAP